MSDPVSIIAVAGVALSAVSAGVGAVGAMNSAKAQSENAAYQAQVAKNNQIIASQNAEFTIQAGQVKAADEALKNRQRQGAVLTGLAANGLDVNSGTPLAVEETEKETGALGTQRVIDAASLQAYGYRSQEANFGATAGLETAEASQATTAGDVAAAGGLIGGASSVGLNYSRLSQAGAFSGSPTVTTNANGGVPKFADDSNDF